MKNCNKIWREIYVQQTSPSAFVNGFFIILNKKFIIIGNKIIFYNKQNNTTNLGVLIILIL